MNKYINNLKAQSVFWSCYKEFGASKYWEQNKNEACHAKKWLPNDEYRDWQESKTETKEKAQTEEANTGQLVLV